METTKEMLEKVIELKQSTKKGLWFDVDEDTAIYVKVIDYRDKLEISIEWLNQDTDEIYEAAVCHDYDDNEDIESALDYIRRCALDGR